MKKQIFILTVFVLAMIAEMNKSYGQELNYLEGAPQCTQAVELNCASSADELHPLPGKTYTYSITTSPSVESIHWFVTDVADVILARTLTSTRDGNPNGSYIQQATAGVYDVPANTTASIDISWNSFDGASNQVLLVAYVKGIAGCSDNIEVWRIEPSFAFTLDIAALLNSGQFGDEECVSPVESAQYDGTNLTMDYGENWVFFSVNAANFIDSWMPELTATGPAGTGTVEWAYPADAQADANWHPTTVPVEDQNGSGEVGTDGECIVVRVLIDHGNNPIQGTDETVTLQVNGIMYDVGADNYTNQDLRDLDEGSPNCVNDVTDEATYTLKARPEITDTTPNVAPGFEPKN